MYRCNKDWWTNQNNERIFLSQQYYKVISFSKIVLSYDTVFQGFLETFIWLSLGLIICSLGLYFWHSFSNSLVFLCPLIVNLLTVTAQDCAASNREFKYFFKRVSCFRCQPSHYHHTSSAHFAQTFEHQGCKSHFEQSRKEKQGISFSYSSMNSLFPCCLLCPGS